MGMTALDSPSSGVAWLNGLFHASAYLCTCVIWAVLPANGTMWRVWSGCVSTGPGVEVTLSDIELFSSLLIY